MAQQEQNVNGRILWETGDDLDETNLATVNARNNSANYVERGLGFTNDFVNNTTTIGNTNTRGNYAVVENNSLAYDLLPDQAADIPFANNASTNHVYLAYDRSANQARYHIDDDDTAPTDPSLKIGTIDAPNNSSSTTNRDPDGTFETATTGQVDNDDYHEKVVTQSGSTGSLDLSAANVFEQTVTGNITFSFNNPEGTPAGNSFLLIVIQDGTGGHTLSWPAAVEWNGGSAPGVSTAANDKHIFSFVSPDGGTTWYGFVAAENVA